MFTDDSLTVHLSQTRDQSSYIAEFHKLNRALILNAKKACFPILAAPTKTKHPLTPAVTITTPSKRLSSAKINKYKCLSLLRRGPLLPLQIPQSLHISFPSRVLCILGLKHLMLGTSSTLSRSPKTFLGHINRAAPRETNQLSLSVHLSVCSSMLVATCTPQTKE